MATKEESVRHLLLKNRGIAKGGWPGLESKRPGKKNANKFLLGASIDYQIKADTAWDNAEILAKIVLDDPDDLWGTIKKRGLDELRDAFKGKCRGRDCRRCKKNHELIKTRNSRISRHKTLHRFTGQAAKKVWMISQNITKRYNGDARNIWKGRSPEDVQNRLADIGFGPNISHMVAGALVDTRQIKGRGRLKADLHVRRVLGRAFTGDKVTAEEAHRIAEKIKPGNTWAIDRPLFRVGQLNCYASNPNCPDCFLKSKCKYYKKYR